jgi:hypothetical protein
MAVVMARLAKQMAISNGITDRLPDDEDRTQQQIRNRQIAVAQNHKIVSATKNKQDSALAVLALNSVLTTGCSGS